MSGVGSGNTLSPILTGLFNQVAQDDSAFKGQIAAPMVPPIKGTKSDYHTLTTKAWLNLHANDDIDRTQPMSKSQAARRTDLEFSTKNIQLERYADSVVLTDVDLEQWRASANVDVSKPALAYLYAIAKGIHEYKTFAEAYVDANFANAVDPGNWDTSTVDLWDPLFLAKRTILRGIGRNPNFGFMSDSVRDEVLQLDDVINTRVAQASYAAIPDGDGLKAIMKAMVGVQLEYIESVYEGSGGTVDTFMGADFDLVYLESGQGPSFARTFTRDTRRGNSRAPSTAGLASVKSIQLENPDGLEIIADCWFKVEANMAAAGYRLKDVLS